MKIALVSLVEDKYWQSCFIITNGLREAYSQLGSRYDVQEWRISRLNSQEAVQKVAADIANAAADLVVFVDTSPLYGIVIKNLREQTTARRPKLRFHVYGDFTMRAYLWESWENDLKPFVCEWTCASSRQQKMVSALTTDEAHQNWVCPFPVSKTGFHFDSSARRKMRRTFGFKKNDFVIYYTGRLALQKNVLAILQMATQLDADLRARVHFVFAGDFDDRGAPFKGTSLQEGEFFCIWQAALAKLPASLRRRVHLLGGLDHDALQETYSAADCFLSLSLQHDEDFGMAPAEAALAGLPMVLTGWGGYADFQNMGATTSMIRVHLSEAGPRFDVEEVAAAVMAVAAQPLSEATRKRRGLKVAKHLSPNAVALLIRAKTPVQKIAGSPFTNFSPVLKDVSTFFDETRQHLVYPDCKEGSTYEQIYQHYV